MDGEHWEDFIEQIEDRIESDVEFILQRVSDDIAINSSQCPDSDINDAELREMIKKLIKEHAMSTFNADIKDLYVKMMEDCIFSEL